MDRLVQQQEYFFDEFNQSPQQPTPLQVNFPKIDIPSFSGDYRDWPSFKDLFVSSVDKRDNLADSAKLQYLKGALKGEAAALVKHLSITDANYNEAWQKLVKRYDKKKQILSSYINAFLDQPAVSPSSQSLAVSVRRLADTSDQIIRGIKVLGAESTSRDPWLIHLLVNKLDSETKKAWAAEPTNTESATFDNFIEFLNTRCDALETCNPVFKRNTSQPVRNLHLDTSTLTRCSRCNQDHHLFKCPEYKKLDVSARRMYVAKKSLCFNCLNSGHSAQNCRSKFRCHFCRKQHHSSLHDNQSTQLKSHTPSNQSKNESHVHLNQPSTSNSSQPKSSDHKQSHIGSYTIINQHQVQDTLLPTAVVHVVNARGLLETCRILLDSGSQASFISEDCITRLGLRREKAKITVQGISSSTTAITRGRVTLTLSSRISPKHQLCVHAYVLDKLTAPQPSRTFKFNAWHLLKGYQMADPQFNTSRKVDIILGADHFIKILQHGQHQPSSELPPLQNTIFGYIIAGSLTFNEQPNGITSLHANLSELDATLKRFWKIADLPHHDLSYTEEEERCESFFVNNHHVDPATHRYVVRLSFKEEFLLLGQSIRIASSCFKSLKKRLSEDAYISEEYKKFMAEYETLNHMERIPSEVFTQNTEHAYLPHHAVVKPTSTTTKVRVVFNGSAKTDNGLSINQKMLVGPKVQRDLMDILLSFRTNNVAMVADIENM